MRPVWRDRLTEARSRNTLGIVCGSPSTGCSPPPWIEYVRPAAELSVLVGMTGCGMTG
jgi:hypothetical protein